MNNTNASIKLKLKKTLKSLKYTPAMVLLAGVTSSLTTTAYANEISNSQIGQGFVKMINDASAFLLIAAPITGIALVIYFFIRKGMADEMDQKKWNGRILTAVLSTVGALVASVIINVVTGYFQ